MRLKEDEGEKHNLITIHISLINNIFFITEKSRCTTQFPLRELDFESTIHEIAQKKQERKLEHFFH